MQNKQHKKPATPIDLIDPLVLQAEKILTQRQSRMLMLDPDLLGEPGWDILLAAYIAGGKGHACMVDQMAADLNLSERLAQRWVAILAEHDLLESRDNLVVLTTKAEKILSDLFKLQLNEIMREIRALSQNLETSGT